MRQAVDFGSGYSFSRVERGCILDQPYVVDVHSLTINTHSDFMPLPLLCSSYAVDCGNPCTAVFAVQRLRERSNRIRRFEICARHIQVLCTGKFSSIAVRGYFLRRTFPIGLGTLSRVKRVNVM